MRALSIHQPYAELIPSTDSTSSPQAYSGQALRPPYGIKTAELRSISTTIVGERFYIYAARTPGDFTGFAALDCEPGDLPTGIIVATATITKCVRENGHYEWHLIDVQRINRPRKPKRMPQPVWFKPF